MIYNDYYFDIIQFFVLFIQINGSIKTHRLESEHGSTIVLPPCLSTRSSSIDDITVRTCLPLFLGLMK
jgi:hypothetical protein